MFLSNIYNFIYFFEKLQCKILKNFFNLIDFSFRFFIFPTILNEMEFF